MAKTVKVTEAQRAAAKYIVARSAKSGRIVPGSVKKIAGASESKAAAQI